MKRALLAATALVFVSGSQASAQAEQAPAVCTFTYDNGAVSPGLVAMGSRSAKWSAGPAPLLCKGMVGGQEVTGPGVIQSFGTLEGSCGSGTGTGTIVTSVPTAKGIVRAEYSGITFSWKGPLGPFEGPGIRGLFEFYPTAGDCITGPLTGYRQLTQVALG